MFRIRMLPANHGDSLLVEYGDAAKPSRILIDCGTDASFPALEQQILALPEDQRHFELFVVTHVDDDHIGGSLKLLPKLQALGVTFGDAWFNAFPHLEGKAIRTEPDMLGARQGEALSKLIVEQRLPWNRAFGGRAVVCAEGALPEVVLPGGMQIRLLSPYWKELGKMKAAWIRECEKAHLIPGSAVRDDLIDDTLGDDVDTLAKLPFDPDDAPANGSSIAFLATFGETRVLFGADAYAPVLVKSLQTLGHHAANPLRLDALKAPHHGSSHNFSRDLMAIVPSKNILISTNGAIFHHPDLAAIARMVRYNQPDSTLHFNYSTKHNAFWGDPNLQVKYRYTAVYPEAAEPGCTVSLA